MKSLKILIVGAMAAAALMAFAASASATTITVTTGDGSTDTLPAGATLSAELEAGTKWILQFPFIGEITCAESRIAGEVTNAGGATETVKDSLSTLTFNECNATVTVLKPGSLEIHTEGATANGNGTLTSSGTEFTLEVSGMHCIFSTSSTDLGTVTGTHIGHVIFHIPSAPIPRTGGRSGAFCGSSATLRATYTVTDATAGVNSYTNFTID